MTLLGFSIQGKSFAIQISAVEMVLMMVKPRPLPGAPPSILGIFSLHSDLIPVIDPAIRLGLKSVDNHPTPLDHPHHLSSYQVGSRLLIIKAKEQLFALLVERIEDLFEVEPSALKDVPLKETLQPFCPGKAWVTPQTEIIPVIAPEQLLKGLSMDILMESDP
ncbi:chemotaxis protein CheW [Magnetococcales bacterium HHB-1]